MKFIKTADNRYLRAEIISELCRDIRYGKDGKKLFSVEAKTFYGDMPYCLSCFDTKEEARAYLDKLVGELNAEDKKCGE